MTEKRRFLYLFAAFFLLTSTFLTKPAQVYAQDWHAFSADIDSDGLTNELEESGWENAAGSFTTDPLDADSDDDGLTDGEEKLYDTIPVNGPGDLNGTKSPGLYVKYEDSLYTREYFSVTDPKYLSVAQAGDRYLMTEAMVLRRGTTFRIGGPHEATLTISGSGLTPLTEANGRIQKDPCRGGWTVHLPADGTVGTYTATVSMPGWQKAMPIYVIFELPTSELSWAEIEAFICNDAPADLRDETAVIWRTRLIPYEQDGYEYRISKAWAEVFWTDHYQEYVFIDQIMPRIHGTTNQHDATEVLSAGADDEARVDWSRGHYIRTDMWTTLHKYWDGIGWTQYGTPCHAHAGLLTGFLRSAGIAARPFMTDHSWTSYDTSVLVWLFNSQWRAARSWKSSEASDTDPPPDGYKYYPFTSGYRSDGPLDMWYNEKYENVLAVVTEEWDYEQWRPKEPGETCPIDESSNGEECFLGGMVDTHWRPDDYMTNKTWEYYWDSRIPLEFYRKHPYVESLNVPAWQGNPWVPEDPDPKGHHTPPWPTELPSPYYDLPNPYPGGDLSENWPIEPVPQGCTVGYLGVCPYGVGGLGAVGFEAEEVGQSALRLPQVQSDRVQFGPVVNDYGLDTDGNGRFDELIIDVEVTASQPGHYILGAILGLPGDPTPYGGLYSSNLSVDLVAGTQTVQLSFDGLAIGSYKVNGPYQVTGLWITDF